MSAFLETLREANLEEFYTSFINNGITNLEELSVLMPNDYTLLGVLSSADRKNLHTLIERIKAAALTPKKPVNTTPRISRAGSLSRGKAPGTRPVLNVPKPVRQPEAQPRPSDLRPKPKPVGRKSLNLDAYGLPVRNTSDFSPVTCRLSKDLAEKIRVCIRKRPLSTREKNRGENDIVDIIGRRSLILNEPKLKVDMTKYIDRHKFIFDEAIESTADNHSVYERTAKPLISHVFQGGKATCFAYGQTGSGKTYTMLDELSGLYVLTARDMFSLLDKPEYGHLGLWISFFEIYQGNIIDLLNKRARLFARDDGNNKIVIKDLREVPLRSVENLIEVFEYGNGARSTGTTEANADSSRSHAIMQLSLKRKGKKNETYGRFSFIDLAGSERGADRGEANAQTRLEGAEINKSLLALKECIRALDQDKTHLPFRQSKLTQVLKESFVGDSRTCMIATICPNISNSEHTLNTLRYADRVKELRGETINDEPYVTEEAMDEGEAPSPLEIEEELQPTEELPEPVPIADEDYPSIEPSAPAVINIPTRLSFPSEERTYTVPRASLPRYSMHTIESVARNHRAQIRLVAELCKTETQLLTDLTNRMAMSGTDLQTTKEVFENYMFELDELLERKLVCIEELKEQLAQVLSRTNRYH